MNPDFLPLKSYANIIEGIALILEWESVVPKHELNYIMGNPPFVGARLMSSRQKKEVLSVFGEKWKKVGNLDYVCCWYKKAAEFMMNNNIRTAVVSTNFVSQGDANFWKPLFEMGCHIDFAHRTFRWDSEVKIKAHVHCVIIGFSIANSKNKKILYTGDTRQEVANINTYLLETDNIFIESRTRAIYNVPEIGIRNKPIDGGNYLFTEDEIKEFIKEESDLNKYFKPWYGL